MIIRCFLNTIYIQYILQWHDSGSSGLQTVLMCSIVRTNVAESSQSCVCVCLCVKLDYSKLNAVFIHPHQRVCTQTHTHVFLSACLYSGSSLTWNPTQTFLTPNPNQSKTSTSSFTTPPTLSVRTILVHSSNFVVLWFMQGEGVGGILSYS